MPPESSKPTEAQPRADAVRNRERILAAAATLFETDQEASLVDIADAAGLSRATAYRHFPDVESIRVALGAEAVDVGRELLQDQLAKLFDDGPDQRPVADGMLQLFETALTIEHRSRAALTEQPDQDAALITTFAPMARALLRRGQLRGEFRDDLDLDVISEALIAIALYAVRRVHRDGVAIDRALSIVQAFLSGLGKMGRRPTA